MSARLLSILSFLAATAAFCGPAVVCGPAAFCAEPPSPSPKPIEAELLSRLSARNLNAGDIVYARVARDWTGPGCHLRRGATLEAVVRLATPHSHSSRSELALSFERAECGETGLQPFRLELQALAAPGESRQDEPAADLPSPDAGPESGPETGMVKTIALHPVVSNADPVTTLRPGEVRGLRNVRLSVAAGPKGSSVIVHSDADVQIEAYTRLLLRPVKTAPQPAYPGTSAAVSFLHTAPVTLLPTESNDLESDNSADSDLTACPPAQCAGISTDGEEERTYSGSIPLHELGYAARSNREILAPSDDEVLAWLSPHELLVTFNPHQLVPRYASSTSDHPVRIIRAVLVDVSSHKIRQTLDWHLTDRRPFLWHLPGNRVLVHVGNELRVYGAGLQVEQRIALAGPLAFARVSPDGGIIAIGIIRERHTPALHASLAASLERDPDEDVEVVLMNDRFQTLGAALGNSDASAPVLLNEGQVKAVLAPGRSGETHRRYSLQLRTWDDNVRSLARFQSSCTPQVSSLPPDLIFLLTCGKPSGAREYRVLRSDGRPVLHGVSYLRELGHAASGGGSPNTFALRIFQADVPMVNGEPFHAADLESAELIIYRCQDGKRLATVHVKDPAASTAGYAVSPSGEIAVLTRDDVDVYSLHHK